MKSGTGVEAVRERIRKSFLEVHHDQRTREQREADEEMLARIAPPKSGAETVRERIQEAFRQIHTDLGGGEEEERQQEADASIDDNANSIPNDTTERRVNAYVSAAVRSPHIAKHPPMRSDVHRCYIVEEPSESVDTLITQALRHLEEK